MTCNKITIKFKYKQAREVIIMKNIEFYPSYEFTKNYHNRYLSKRAFIQAGTTSGRWNETLYLVEFYENDILL